MEFLPDGGQDAHALTMADRERAGRADSPTGAILDAQAARSGGVGVIRADGWSNASSAGSAATLASAQAFLYAAAVMILVRRLGRAS